MLKYSTITNSNGVALNGATIKPQDFIFLETPTNVKTPIQFGLDGVYPGTETFASGSPFWYPPANKKDLGGSINAKLPNSLSVGSHTISVKDRENTEIATATFTVG